MSWVRVAVWMGLALALVAVGCKGEDADDDDDDDVAGDDDVIQGSPADYTGGDFMITTVAVSDGCLDGALEVLFMPDGPATPNAWEYPTYLPPFADMPSTYAIDLREPFMGIVITVEDAGNYQMRVEDAVMEEVLLGEDRYGDCAVTMTCDVDLTVLGRNRVEGTTAIALSDPRGDDGRCPVFDQLPCTMTLTLTGGLAD
jgi:hypothetical protein